MRAGAMKRRIRIQQQSATRDSFGQQLQTWTDAHTCWAAIRSASSREVYAASGFVSQLSHVITIRYSVDQAIKAGMQVLYGTRTFRVQGVSDPDESRRLQQLLCLEE